VCFFGGKTNDVVHAADCSRLPRRVKRGKQG
jgi:hypothetical protein